jgi:DNA-binding GntR family transcriptional regulator
MTVRSQPPRTTGRSARRAAASIKLPLAPRADESLQTMQKQAYATLKAALLAGRFRPGQAVTVRALSEMLGTSAMPVREALRRLTSEGAFEDLSNRSTRVPRLDRVQIMQILELRMYLEGTAAEQATRNMSLHRLEELQALQNDMEQALAKGNHEDYTSLNTDFHFRIYAIAGNDPLLSLIEALWLRMAPLVSLAGTLAASRPELLRRLGHHHHGRLLKAFRAHDAKAASDAIRADIFDATKVPGYWEAVDDLGSIQIAKQVEPGRTKSGVTKSRRKR